MKKEALQLYWLKDDNDVNAQLKKRVRYRDCAYSALSMLNVLANALNSTPQIITVAIYMVLIYRMFSEKSVQVMAKAVNFTQLLKADVCQCNTFAQLVEALMVSDMTADKTSNEHNCAVLELLTSKNKILFSFEASGLFVEDYIAATMIKRFRELLKKLAKNPDCQLNDLDIITLNEKKIIQEWHRANAHYQKNKNKLQIIDQQIKLIPRRVLIQYS
jgi:hypothetical protein